MFMKYIAPFFILFIILTSPLICIGQDSDSTEVFNPYIDDITQRIPSLEDLIDSALVHSPMLKFQDADIAFWKYKVKTARREFMQNFYIDGLLQTDIWDAYTSNQTNVGSLSEILTFQDSYRALVSVSLRLPMDDFYDRRNRVKTAFKDVEKSMAQKDNLILQLRKDIILQYNTLIVNQRVLKIANDNVIANALQKEMGDKEFLNGQTTLYELARINEMYRKAVTDFETARIAFYNAYMILQEMTGIKFNVSISIE